MSEGLKAENDLLRYWLLRAYHAHYRQGWEEGESTIETFDDIVSVLANLGIDPNTSNAARAILAKQPWFNPAPSGAIPAPAARPRDMAGHPAYGAAQATATTPTKGDSNG